MVLVCIVKRDQGLDSLYLLNLQYSGADMVLICIVRRDQSLDSLYLLNLQYSGADMMLVGIVLRIRDIDVAWLSRFLRFSAEGFDSSGGVAVHSHLIREKKNIILC